MLIRYIQTLKINKNCCLLTNWWKNKEWFQKRGRNLEKNDKTLIENHHNGYMTQRSNKSKLYDEADAKYPWSNYKRRQGIAMEKNWWIYCKATIYFKGKWVYKMIYWWYVTSAVITKIEKSYNNKYWKCTTPKEQFIICGGCVKKKKPQKVLKGNTSKIQKIQNKIELELQIFLLDITP